VTVERRKWPRLDLNLSVEFESKDPASDAGGTGTTQNVSAGGIYFLTPNWRSLEPGTKLQIQLSGLAQLNAGPIFRSLKGEATVLRLEVPEEEKEESYAKAGVAARFDERPSIETYRRSA
jgi:hypothetical protein